MPLRCTEKIQAKKTRESTRDREGILFEKKSGKEAEKKAKQIKKSQLKKET